jgi:hypothetical protein
LKKQALISKKKHYGVIKISRIIASLQVFDKQPLMKLEIAAGYGFDAASQPPALAMT